PPRLASYPVSVRGRLRVEHDLHNAAAVPQVDEDQSALVAATVHPARERYVAAGVAGAKVATVACLEHVSSCTRRGSGIFGQCNAGAALSEAVQAVATLLVTLFSNGSRFATCRSDASSRTRSSSRSCCARSQPPASRP